MDITKIETKSGMIEFFGNAKNTYTAYGCTHGGLCQMPEELDYARRCRFIGSAVLAGRFKLKVMKKK